MTTTIFQRVRGLGCCLLLYSVSLPAQQIRTAGAPAELSIREAGEHSIRITLKPLSSPDSLPFSPALAEHIYSAPALSLTTLTSPVKAHVGPFNILVRPGPLCITITTLRGQPVQELIFHDDNTLSFAEQDAPILGLGEGGHKPVAGTDWRSQPIEFDRRGQFQEMQPRWQSDAYGSRNPVPLLIGTAGWGLFIASPWVQVDLRAPDHGIFLPWRPAAADTMQQNEKNQSLALSKGLPPASSVVPGLYDLFVFDAQDPLAMMKDLSELTGKAVMPPKWALGYMQSHRTIKDETRILGIVDSFRAKKIPVDAVIYLGTGFTPSGWNTSQPSFTFNPVVFHREPSRVLADLHDRHVKVVLHMVPWDRDKLPSLHGTIPALPEETKDAGHIQTYWQQHVPLLQQGVDAFWPDEGDWFNLYERIKRHQLYYQGPLSTFANTRPWSLHRNGYLGIARWGGWVWSGDTTARHIGSEYLWGKDMLIAPIFEKAAASRTLYLPAGLWYDWWTNTPQTGGHWISRPVDLTIMPIYVHAGAIIPLDPVRQYTAQPVTAPTVLQVYPGSDGAFTFYDDDGISQDYLQERSGWIELSWHDQGRTFRLRPGTARGVPVQAVHKTFVVRLMTDGAEKKVKYEGKEMDIRL